MRIITLFEKLRSKAFFWKTFVWNAPSDYKFSLGYKLKWALRGWSADEAKMFDFDNNNPRDYLSDSDRMRSRYRINPGYCVTVLDNKLLFEEVFSKYVRIPVNFAYVRSDGALYGLKGLELSRENFVDFVKEKGTVVLKYLNGSGGEGVHKISWGGG